MKKFLKWVLAVICGIVIFNILLVIFIAGIAGSITPESSSSTTLPKEGVLYVDMSKFALAEQPSEEMDFTSLISSKGTSVSTVGLYDAVNALNIAAEDDAIKYLYLRTDSVNGGISQLEEFRIALDNFRKSGKAIVSIIGYPSNAGYFIASVSDKIYMSQYRGGTSTFLGASSQLFFLKDLLDMLGVNVQLIRHGKYKSAGEMYIKNAPSSENLEQNEVMIKSIWKTYASAIAKSRNITEERLNEMLDNLELILPEDFLNAGLVDEILDAEQRRAKLADLAMVDDFDAIKFISFPEYVNAKKAIPSKAKQKIAIIYADGQIVDGSGKTEVAGDYFASEISKVRKDSTIKAVLFRVNSPGGSVVASEKIKEQIDLLKADKPVVASFGDYAASGGYWISNNCDKIFADNTTLTGSIGVFSIIPDFSGTAKKIAHVNVTAVNSNKHGDMLNMMRPLNTAETDAMQRSVEDIYTNFVNYVAQGRNLTPEFVDSIAQGRVWAGSDAIGIRLVDEIGTLEDALHYTAALVNDGNEDLSVWKIESYPKPQSTFEQIMEMFGNQSKSNALTGTPFEKFGKVAMDWYENVSKTHEYVFARMPYEIIIR